jgi:hypothetical protein
MRTGGDDMERSGGKNEPAFYLAQNKNSDGDKKLRCDDSFCTLIILVH